MSDTAIAYGNLTKKDTQKAPKELIPRSIKNLRQVYEILKMIETHVKIMEEHDAVDNSRPEKPKDDQPTPQPPINIELEHVITSLENKASDIASRIENVVEALYGVS